jgi:hypothetical protein
MSPLTLLIGVVLAIMILWAVNTYLPHPLRLVLSIVVIIVLTVCRGVARKGRALRDL